MNREEFLSACGECEVGYRAQLLDFYRNYADIVDKIYDKYALLDGEDQNKMLVKRLKSWLEQRAYSGIVSTINTLDENSEQKVLGFIHLYDYILKSTDDIAFEDIPVSDIKSMQIKGDDTELSSIEEKVIRYDLHFKARNPKLSSNHSVRNF